MNFEKLKLFTKKPEDLKALSETLAPLIDRGLPIQASVVLDRIGFPEPEDGADLLKPKGGGMAEPATDEDGNVKFLLFFFVTLAVGISLGAILGHELAAARCYEIKTERCLGEPIVTECVCEGGEGKIEVKE